METLVRIKEQAPLRQFSRTDIQGQLRSTDCVELVLTDGLNTFVGDLTDDRARAISASPLDQSKLYRAELRFGIRMGKTSQGSAFKTQSCRILSITEL